MLVASWSCDGGRERDSSHIFFGEFRGAQGGGRGWAEKASGGGKVTPCVRSPLCFHTRLVWQNPVGGACLSRSPTFSCAAWLPGPTHSFSGSVSILSLASPRQQVLTSSRPQQMTGRGRVAQSRP